MSKPRAGFTFIELIVSMLIFSIVALSIYLSFNVGIRAWRNGEEGYKMRQGARYLMSSLSRDMRNAVSSKEIMFSGNAGSVSFCKASNGLFKVSYEFNGSESAVYKIVQTYKENSSGETGSRSRLISGVSDFQLQYSYRNGDKIEWRDAWQEQENSLPFAVKVSLTYNQGGEAQPAVISQTVVIPTGMLEEEQ